MTRIEQHILGHRSLDDFLLCEVIDCSACARERPRWSPIPRLRQIIVRRAIAKRSTTL